MLALRLSRTYCEDSLRTWKEFLRLVRNSRMTTSIIRPHAGLGDDMKPLLLGFTDSPRKQAAPEDWNNEAGDLTRRL